MKPTDVPVNYVGDGRWHFEADFGKYHWEFDIIPHLFLYTLQFPNGKRVWGTIPTLLTQLETRDHDPPQAKAWLKNAIRWDYRKSDYKQEEKEEAFSVEDRDYGISFNARTGAVNLHFDAIMIVSDRRNLTDLIPVYSIGQGELSKLLDEFIGSEIPDTDYESDAELHASLPMWTERVGEFEINGWKIWIAYDPGRELVFLHFDARTINSDISSLPHLWEFNALHDGKYRKKVMGILADNGFMDASL